MSHCDVYLVMDYSASIIQTIGKATFAQTITVIEVSIAAVLPLLG